MVTAVKTAYKHLSAIVFFILNPIFINGSYATLSEAEFLSNVAKQYMLAQFPQDKSKRYEVNVGHVDGRKDYGGKCSGFLTAKLKDSRIKKNNVVVIHCAKKENPFTVYVPVNVSVLKAVTSAKDNIAKGSLITEQMLENVFVPESSNSSSTVTDAQSLIGSKSRKDIKAGEILRVTDFCVVSKGDTVTIEASSGGLTIRTTGIAMQEGRLNDTIQVKNAKSKKIIDAIVSGPGQVRVIF